MKPFVAAASAATLTALLCACSEPAPSTGALRPVNTMALHYDSLRDSQRYFASVASRYEVEQAFRIGGKVLVRKVDVGQVVKEGNVLAILDDADYLLAEEAARQRLAAAKAAAWQAESDWQRLSELKKNGSVSASHEEQAHSTLLTARAAAQAEARQFELARNQVNYTQLRAPISGVVTALRMETGQVVVAGQPVITLANEGKPEIVADIPENRLAEFKAARYKAALATAPERYFAVELRELSAQASAQTRTYRARLKPVEPRALPLGATATLIAERTDEGTRVATLPATALTQEQGAPAVWTVQQDGKGNTGTVKLVKVAIQGYRSDEVLVSGPAEGALVVTAGVQKMAPGLRVALPAAASASRSEREEVTP
ncbi:efflux RND transporter periplasmic adaptor subunit [Aeromonas sanarellii]|uniref:efflux RND transporter periplasmic adaptor subunit n=1 Tax=Aeromonas TaxID=642 RepID=UPI002DBE4E21|nr:efflux RND transporter periplasmic adaptor subunit [Aeromonas sanarellii]MEB6606076.1 efflux RND transporter periplasmic adaptor subunit [Aeromonas sanarellii]